MLEMGQSDNTGESKTIGNSEENDGKAQKKDLFTSPGHADGDIITSRPLADLFPVSIKRRRTMRTLLNRKYLTPALLVLTQSAEYDHYVC